MNLRIKKELPQGYEFSQLAQSIQADMRVATLLQIVEGVIEVIAISAMLQYLCGHVGWSGSLVQIGCTVVAALAALGLQWQFSSNLQTFIRIRCDKGLRGIAWKPYATTALMTGLLCLALNSLGAFLVYQNFNPAPTLLEADDGEYKQYLELAQISYDNAQGGIITLREKVTDIEKRWDEHIKAHPAAASWAALQMKKEKAPVLAEIQQAEQTAQAAYEQRTQSAQTAYKQHKQDIKQQNEQAQTGQVLADNMALVFAVLGSLILLCLIWMLTTRATKTEVQTGVTYDVTGDDHSILNNINHAITERIARIASKIADKIRDKQPVLSDKQPKQDEHEQDEQHEQAQHEQDEHDEHEEQPQPIPQTTPTSKRMVEWNGKRMNRTDIQNRLRTHLHRAHNSTESAAQISNMGKFEELKGLAEKAGFVIMHSVSNEKQERTKKTKSGLVTVHEYKVKIKVK